MYIFTLALWRSVTAREEPRNGSLWWGWVMNYSGIVHHRAIFGVLGGRKWLRGNGLQAPPKEGR